MRQESAFDGRQGIVKRTPFSDSFSNSPAGQSFLSRPFTELRILFVDPRRQAMIGVLLLVALLAFEIFNFDTNQYAMSDLLDEVGFFGLKWATILAIAFCAIDIAGLACLVGLDRASEQHTEVWYLMGAWLIGATMNALMTWWAFSVSLISHDLGNKLIGNDDLSLIVPVFVAALVWLTRILFIGMFSYAGSYLFGATSEPRHGIRLNSTKPADQYR